MATTQQCKDFIELIAPVIVNEGRKRGYKIFSATIAQACIESAYGTSSLGYKYHNYFGMKCGSKWKGKSVNLKTKEEYTVGTLTSISANFRAYDSLQEGVAGYYDFISASRYANLKTASSYKEFAEFLKADGYATSSSYVNTLVTTVKKWNLQQYDDVSIEIAKPVLKKGAKSDEVKKLQTNLNTFGYGLTIDGSFGPKTETALKDWQVRNNLAVDGSYGPKSYAKMQELLK